jgi:Predicted periplasmic ligand-binding sensor domain
MSTTSNLGTYIVTGHKPYAEMGQRGLMDLRSQFDELENLLADSPKQLKHVKQMRQIVDVQLKELQALEPTEERNSFSFLWSHMKEFRETMQEVGIRSGQLMRMIASEKEQLTAVRREEQETRKTSKIKSFTVSSATLSWWRYSLSGLSITSQVGSPSSSPMLACYRQGNPLCTKSKVMMKSPTSMKLCTMPPKN